MATKVTHPRVVLAEIERQLRSHPGDAPWSCVDCYHNRPCIEKSILVAAKKEILRCLVSA